jgi:predicted permease
MRKLKSIAMRLRGLFRSHPAESDFAAELESHVALHTADGIRAGLSPAEARRQALICLGGAEQTRQAHRERRTFLWLESLIQDTHYGLRTLRRSPGFTITAVLTLALGIGACTAIFSLVNAVLIRSLPYGDPSRLVYLYTPNPQFKLPPEVFGPAYPDFYDLKRDSRSFQSMTAFDQSVMSLSLAAGAERMSVATVDGDFFLTFQAVPEMGRAVTQFDNQQGHEKVAVISHALWQSMFGADPGILRRSLTLNGHPYQIIGVMPAGFEYPHFTDLPYGNPQCKTTQVWIPLALSANQLSDRDNFEGNAVARLKSGVSIAQAQAEMSTIMARLDKLHDAHMRGWRALVEGFVDSTVGHVRSLLWLLLAAVCLVLLIACGNAANLLLARAANRARELSVRIALGAGRKRIARQLLTESLLIAAAAGVIGTAFAYVFLRTLPLLDPGNIPRLHEASLDPRVLVFTVAVSLLTSLITGIVPALAVSKVNLADFLASSANRSVTGAHSLTQGALTVAESALVVVLLSGAGLLLRSYINVANVDTGFSPSTVTTNINFNSRFTQAPERAAFFENLLNHLEALPGVQAAGAITQLPLSNSQSLSEFSVEGYPNQNGQLVESRWATIHYFAAMNIPLIAGRAFAAADYAANAHNVIVNRAFAEKYFAGRDAVGGHVSRQDDHLKWDLVVGVVGDVHHNSLEEQAAPEIYHPASGLDSGYVAVRSTLPEATVAAEIRSTMHSVDRSLAPADIQTMGDLISEASAQRRFQTSLLTVFAAIALFLALVGLYGLMAYSVSRRTREVGIRMALGAQRADVMFLVLRKAAFLLGLGLMIGLAASWFATRAIQSFLFGVGQHDPTTILSVCALLAVCGMIAALIPARRAASIDPMQALRTE